MTGGKLSYLYLSIVVLISLSQSLYIRGAQSSHVLELPFRTVKFIDKYIFFVTNNGRYFGYINTLKKGAINVIYQLDHNERLIDDFSTSNKLIIGNKNKTLLYFHPYNRTLELDPRLINQNFKELKAFTQINNQVYVISENAVLLFKQSTNKKFMFVKELLSKDMLNPGVTEFYYNLYHFPTKKNPERVIVLTTVVFENNQDTDAERFLSCFKWFEGQTHEVDGKCTIEKRIDIQDFRVTGRWAYLRMPDETYVYDDTLTMKTKWQQIPTQYITGHAVTSDQLTYLYKTNQLAYYRLIENYKNDDVKMTVNGQNIFISKKGKTFVKLTKAPQSKVAGAWMEQTDQLNHRLFLQFEKRDLHCYKLEIKEGSIETTYLFRLTPNQFGFSGYNDWDGEFKLVDGILPHKTINLAQKWASQQTRNLQL